MLRNSRSRPVRVENYSKKEFDEMPKAKQRLIWHVRAVFPKPTVNIEAAEEPEKPRKEAKAEAKRKAKG